MEQPPGSLDNIQPQDLSTSSSTSVIDLTRKGQGCVRSDAVSIDALQMVSSNWCPESDASKPALISDVALQPGDQVRPDVALSHTTVTVSYVSRPHVFSSHDSLSQRLPLCGVPAISKLPLNPPGDSDARLRETSVPLDQHYSEKADGPVDLATQTELFQTSSQAQVGPESCGSIVPRDTNEVNGGGASPDWEVEEAALARQENSLSRVETKGVIPRPETEGLENGLTDSSCSAAVFAESSPETLTPTVRKEEDAGGAEELLLTSKTKDCVVLPDGLAAQSLCSLKRDYISPLDEPVSPSPTSQDDVEDVFVLPQASSSPSGDNACVEMADEAAWDGASAQAANPLDSNVSASTSGFESSEKDTNLFQKQNVSSVPLIDLTEDVCSSEDVDGASKTAALHMNGNANTLQETLEAKKLPTRSSRETLSKAAAEEVNSNGCEVLERVRSSSNSPTVCDSKFTNDEKNDPPAEGTTTRTSKVSVAEDRAAEVQVKRGNADDCNTDNHRDSTSDPEANNSPKPQSSTPPKSTRSATQKNSHLPPEQPEPEGLLTPPPPDPSAAQQTPATPPPAKSPRRSRSGAAAKSAGRKTPPTAKRKGTGTPRKRRRRRRQSPSSSMFSPKEPEIKLRYVNYKEEKRDARADNFSPFVHVERRLQQQQPSLCTVVNYPEEVRGATQSRRTQPSQPPQAPQPGGFVSTAVPSTSCLQLGRLTARGQHRRALVCCLCGLSANAMDLGDLHGPYYPEGFQPAARGGAVGSEGLREEREDDDNEDSDASSRSSSRSRRRKQAAPPRPQRPGAPLKGRGLRARRRQSADGPGTSPAKKARLDAGCRASAVSADDWYNPPMLPAEPCEFWLHEDCGIWSTGVFLVRGRVYGLEEAVKAAQETTCSACRHPGATLGCFFKSCPNKYHYRCALESDCVLIEENFSMKCKKHKNKTFKAPPGNRLDDR